MSDIVGAIPAVAAVDAELQALRERREKLQAEVSRARERYNEEVRAWEARARDMDPSKLNEVEPRPVPSIDDEAVGLIQGQLRSEEGRLSTERLRAIAGSAVPIQEAAGKVIASQEPKARKAIATLESLTQEVRHALGAVGALRDAERVLSPRRTYRRSRPALTLHGYVDAVLQDQDLLGQLDEPEQRPLGFSNSNLHLPPPEARELRNREDSDA